MNTNNFIKTSSVRGNHNKGIASCAILIILLLSGCASTPTKQSESPIFYPPLPNPPRIQYLNSFSSSRDIQATSSSGFTDFVLGKEDASTLINKPYGVALDKGLLFAVDTRGPGYVVFDLKQQRTYTVSGSGAGHMLKPINMVFDDQGNRYVADTGRDQILVYNNQDKFIRAYGLKDQFKPTDLLLIGDKMYVVDIAHHKIIVLSKQDGSVIAEIGQAGSKNSQAGAKDVEFFHPTNIKLGVDGNLYISDTGNYRIQVVSQDGKFVRSIGAAGSAPGQFARPKGVAVDKKGNIYVVDAAFNNIQVFLPEGELLLVFGGPGAAPGSLDLPTDIEIDYESVDLFQKYAAPGFKLEYVILVANQFGNNKVTAYGYGKMKDFSYQ